MWLTYEEVINDEQVQDLYKQREVLGVEVVAAA